MDELVHKEPLRSGNQRPRGRVRSMKNIVFGIGFASNSEHLFIGDNRSLILGTVLKRLLCTNPDEKAGISSRA